MIIDQIDIGRIAVLEAEDDPPVGADGNAPIAGKIAPERVQPEARQVEVFGSLRHVEPSQYARDLIDVLGVQFAPVVILIKPPQPAMPKPPDHC